MQFAEKLRRLRQALAQDQVAAAVLVCADPHQSESVAAHWKSVQWFTGFTGSVATCVVTAEAVAFWTDGRYTAQAQRELPAELTEQYTVATPGTPSWQEWLTARLAPGAAVALDGEVLSLSAYRDLQDRLPEQRIVYEKSYPAMIWPDRPSIPGDPLYEHALQYAARSRGEKIAAVRARMREQGVDHYLACCLDDIAWLTNLRGHDNPLYPFFHAYLLFTPGAVLLFTDTRKLSAELTAQLAADGIQVLEMAEVMRQAAALSAATIYLDPFKTPYLLYQQIPAGNRFVQGLDLLTLLKACKSPAEQENIRLSNLKECLAIWRFILYIKQQVTQTTLDEYGLGQQLETFRRRDPLYLQPANIPIIAYGANAALPHYRPSRANSSPIKPEGFLLFDLCAQYLTGTTDITRTIMVGPISAEMRRDYTLTLRSHIALATQKFPYGISGNVLDGVAKSVHWNQLQHYGTGTGHGIGYLLNVHEGPCKIMTDYTTMFPYATSQPLEVGMLFSNEPGVYKPGRHGVRLENDILVQEAQTNEFGRFLQFENVTFLPFEREAIDPTLLSEQEVKWLNNYHQETYAKLAPHLEEQERKWLAAQTQAF